PAGGELSGKLKPGDHVVVYRLDRAWRSVRDCAVAVEKWSNMGVHVHLVTEKTDSLSVDGKLFFYALAVVAWVEADILSRNMKRTAKEIRKQGRPVNGEVSKGFAIVYKDGR